MSGSEAQKGRGGRLEEVWEAAGKAGRMRIAREAKNGGEAEERARQHTAHLDEVETGRGGQIATVCTVGFLVLVGGVSVCEWEFFKREAETIRNLVLLWGAPLALGLAMWRSMVAQAQAKIAQRGLLADRYQRAVEMLGHDFLSVRVGGIHALRNLALEHPQYDGEVATVLNLYARGKRWEPTVENKELGIKIPADEWEAEEAAQGLYEARKRRGRKTGL